MWQDFAVDYKEFTPTDPYTEDPYVPALEQQQLPIRNSLYVAEYDNLTDTFLSSGQGSFDVEISFEDQRYISFPAVPVIFSGDLPIVYQNLISDSNVFLNNKDLFGRIKSLFFDVDERDSLSIIDNQYNVVSGYNVLNPSSIDIDLDVSGVGERKEVRFGDFSNTLNSHLIFKNFKIYLKDAVVPFEAKEIKPKEFPIDSLNASSLVVNNYGDVWVVGSDGLMFYMDVNNNLYIAGEDENDISTVNLPDDLTNFKQVTTNNYNHLVLLDSQNLYFSEDHIHGFTEMAGTFPTNMTYIAFDKDDSMFIGTETGIKIYNSYVNLSGQQSSTDITPSDAPTDKVNSIKVDDNNVVWICTDGGLYRYYKGIFLLYNLKTGLPSNTINDIAIRNTAIRYVATSSGIGKMVGSSVDDIIITENSELYSNNVKSVSWSDPNILWAATLSKINQISIDDFADTYST